MAKIELQPQEEFEHYHLVESITKHLEGEIEVSFNNEKIILGPLDEVKIPSHTSHVVKNIGKNKAKFECLGHAVITEMSPESTKN